MKPVILYACECWIDSMKKEIFAKKIKKFHMSVCKQILGVKNLPTEHLLKKISKQKCLSISKDFHLLKQIDTYFKACEENEFDTKDWVQTLRALLDMLELGNIDRIYLR